MDKKAKDGLESLLTKVSSQENKNNSHKTLSYIIMISLLAFIAIGLFRCTSDVISNKPLFRGNIFNKSDKVLSISSVRDNVTLLLIKISKDSSELRVIDHSTNKVYDLTSGLSDIVTASLSNTGNSIAYIKKINNEDKLFIREWRWQSEEYSLSKLLSPATSQKINNGTKKIGICEWSSLEWSPDDSKVAFFLCNQKTSVLATTKSGKDTSLTLFKKTQSEPRNIRLAKWFNESNIIFSTIQQELQIVKRIDVTNTSEENSIVTIYTIGKEHTN